MEPRADLNGWAEDDFVDAATPPLSESDPWEPEALSGSTPDWFQRDRPSFDPDTTSTRQPGVDEDWCFFDELEDVDAEDGWLGGEADDSDWVEPEPTVEAISDLSESLYPPDRTITDISRELKIDRLLVLTEPITDEQRTRCHELLTACETRRLSRWIPWLARQTWCGAKLQLFLEFQSYWQSNRQNRWWETFWWDGYAQTWLPSYQSGTLTLDHARELVEKRSHCAAADVISPAWFEEWEQSAVWELGVRSFASFAVFRAGIPGGENWREYLVRQDRRTQLEMAQCADGSFAPLMLPSFAEQYGLPPLFTTASDPWPDVTDIVRLTAATLGGDLDRSWREVLDRLTGY